MADDNRTANDLTPQTGGTPDPEIAAIGKVNDALAQLDPAVRQRVLRWAADKYSVVLPKGKPGSAGRGNANDDEEEDDTGNGGGSGAFADFASLYEAAAPSTDAERALLAGYYLQVVQHNADWDGFSANKELKNLGHGTDNITDKLQQLIDQRPQLVLQTRKSGTTRQAKKRYKVTGEGIKKVKQMISSAAAAGNGDGGQD